MSASWRLKHRHPRSRQSVPANVRPPELPKPQDPPKPPRPMVVASAARAYGPLGLGVPRARREGSEEARRSDQTSGVDHQNHRGHRLAQSRPGILSSGPAGSPAAATRRVRLRRTRLEPPKAVVLDTNVVTDALLPKQPEPCMPPRCWTAGSPTSSLAMAGSPLSHRASRRCTRPVHASQIRAHVGAAPATESPAERSGALPDRDAGDHVPEVDVIAIRGD